MRSQYTGAQLEFDADHIEEAEEFLRLHTNAIQVIDKPLFAMVTGIVTLKMKGVTLRAMIDTGSELNITGSKVAGRCGLALDTDTLNDYLVAVWMRQ